MTTSSSSSSEGSDCVSMAPMRSTMGLEGTRVALGTRWCHLSIPIAQKRTDEAGFQKLMSNLDSNRDSEVDFHEYATFLACVAVMCNDFFQEYPDKMPRKK